MRIRLVAEVYTRTALFPVPPVLRSLGLATLPTIFKTAQRFRLMLGLEVFNIPQHGFASVSAGIVMTVVDLLLKEDTDSTEVTSSLYYCLHNSVMIISI